VILLAVNFHYVADAPPQAPRAVFPVTPAELELQVATITATFEPVSREQLVAAVVDGAALPERGCVFTFDDGLREQYDLALPVFERLGCPVLFFVPGRPLAEGRALNVHRVHRLREELGDDEVLRLLGPRLDPALLDAVEHDAATAMYRYDTPEAARLKYLLNVSLGPARSEELVAAVHRECFGDEESFVGRLYMGAPEVADLERRGMLGAHAYSHLPLARLAPAELRRELADNLDVLERAAGARPPVVSYPYGGLDAVDEKVAAAAAAAGLAAGFTMERAFNRCLEQPLLLARIDCVDAPGGRRPLFDLDDPLADGAGMAPARTRYFDEASLASAVNARA
jgi:peptidoglycan/xylan/chitin deacetylase (PgdA/CDA1 family)